MILAGILAVVVVAGIGAAIWIKPIRKEVPLETIPVQQDKLELFCMADSEEEAKELAKAYEIELTSYSEKVAVFQTDKSYEEILEIGRNKELTELSINSTIKAY